MRQLHGTHFIAALALSVSASAQPIPIANSGDPAPGTDAVFSSFRLPMTNEHGDVAFRAFVSGSTVNDGNDFGFWVSRDGVLSLVAREGDPVPQLSGVNFGTVDNPALTEQAAVATAEVMIDGESRDLAVVDRDGVQEIVWLSGPDGPQIDGFIIERAIGDFAFAINDVGDFVYQVRMRSATEQQAETESGIIAVRSGVARLLYRSSLPVSIDGREFTFFDGVDRLVMTNNGFTGILLRLRETSASSSYATYLFAFSPTASDSLFVQRADDVITFGEDTLLFGSSASFLNASVLNTELEANPLQMPQGDYTASGAFTYSTAGRNTRAEYTLADLTDVWAMYRITDGVSQRVVRHEQPIPGVTGFPNSIEMDHRINRLGDVFSRIRLSRRTLNGFALVAFPHDRPGGVILAARGDRLPSTTPGVTHRIDFEIQQTPHMRRWESPDGATSIIKQLANDRREFVYTIRFEDGSGIYKFALDGYCDADVNRDFEVNGLDFGAWLSAYNAGDFLADQNRDAELNGLDFGAWLANFNAGCD